MKKRDREKLDNKIREWDEISHKTNDSISKFWKHIRIAIRDFNDSLMFIKRPSNKADRLGESMIWWFKILVIYFALEGFFYKLTGR